MLGFRDFGFRAASGLKVDASRFSVEDLVDKKQKLGMPSTEPKKRDSSPPVCRSNVRSIK